MTGQRQHYCSYCLRYIEPEEDLCPRLSCGKTRPTSGWPNFFEPGENIDGRFRIRRRIGAGGAGVTYRAIDLAADDPEHRDVALKVLHQDRGQGMLQDRLRLEGVVLRRLDHPNVVSFRELKVDGEEPYYLATGFAPGGGLDEMLRRHGRLASRTVLQVGAQIARALAAAHAIGVTHRDLKPSNILVLDPDEFPIRIRVADWGIARAQPEFLPRRHVTIQGGFVGTPEFASPEQLRGEASVGPPTDIFGLGVLMHTLAGGQPVRDLVARGAVNFQALRVGATRYERVPLSAGEGYEPHLPLLDELVDQLITRSPEARPDAESVAAYCEELLEAGDSAPKRGQPLSPLPVLAPAAAFERPDKHENMLLPPDSDKVMPLRLSDPTGEEPPPAPDTLEMADPESIVDPTPHENAELFEAASDAGADPPPRGPVEVPWPREPAEGVSNPTAVPEEMMSIPAMDVLQDAEAPPHEPEQIVGAAVTSPEAGAPVPRQPPVPTPSQEPRIVPLAERDDEPFPSRSSGIGLWVAVPLLLVGGAALLFASPGLRAEFADRVDDLIGGGEALDEASGDASVEAGELPTPRQGDTPGETAAEDQTPQLPSPGITPPGREPPTATPGGRIASSAGAGAWEQPAELLADAGEPSTPSPSPGIVIDHGFEDHRGRVGSREARDRAGARSGVWAPRPGAPRVWEPDYEAQPFYRYQSTPDMPRFVEEMIPSLGDTVTEVEPTPRSHRPSPGVAETHHGKFKEPMEAEAEEGDEPDEPPTPRPGGASNKVNR